MHTDVQSSRRNGLQTEGRKSGLSLLLPSISPAPTERGLLGVMALGL